VVTAPSASALGVRELRATDLDEVVRIDALHTEEAQPAYWKRVFDEFLGSERRERTFGFCVAREGGLAGYLFAEVRAVEFGSEPCGWVFALGIEEAWQRRGVASVLLDAACRRFLEMGVAKVRTMVRRNDVPVLAFFRSKRFVGGPFVQLELGLEEEPS
jgi:ribosomal protein S18 acetylase RimI-like enzyme